MSTERIEELESRIVSIEKKLERFRELIGKQVRKTERAGVRYKWWLLNLDRDEIEIILRMMRITFESNWEDVVNGLECGGAEGIDKALNLQQELRQALSAVPPETRNRRSADALGGEVMPDAV